MRLALFLTLALLSLAGCSPRSRAPERPTEIPVPPLASEGAEATGGIGVRAIFVAWEGAEGAPSDVTRTRAQAEQRAGMVANVAGMSGERFAELVLKYSDRPPLGEAAGRGTLLERGSGLLPEAVEAVAFKLAVGEVSAAIETDQGFVIVQRSDRPLSGPDQIIARHILVAFAGAQRVAPEVTRTREEARALAEKILAQVREDPERWEALWEEHSDEPGAREAGSLGVFGRGQMVPEFERVAFDLEVDEIGGVVETPFGFHVIQRTR